MTDIGNKMVKGFLHTQGRRIVNEDGETVILRGWGTGNWMNPEGFMVGGTTAPDGAYIQPKKLDRARSMDTVLRELCGTEYARSFWPRWYRAHLGEADIRAMAALGYNSTRLVLNGAALLDEEPGIRWNEDTFAMLDQVLDWCEKYRIYAILDLHAAPGGQSAGACDNGVDNVPHLFIDEESWERTILLWEELARRYGGRWIVGGYDLLNEPLNTPDSLKYTDDLKRFYDELIPRVRAIDKKHMLTIEGTIWSTQPSVFDHNYDPGCSNWCIHIHNYGYTPDMTELSCMLERAIDLDVPIWMGEGGADSVNNACFLQMLEEENIGWCLWCWKAVKNGGDSVMSREQAPAAHGLPEDWHLVHDYADHGGPRPSYEKSRRIFEEYLEKIRYENCEYNPMRCRYTLRQPGITVPAVGYDHGENAFSGSWPYGNAFQFREADHMKCVVKPGGVRPGPRNLWMFSGHGWQAQPRPLEDLWLSLGEGEYAGYTVKDVREPCTVAVTARCREASRVEFRCGSLVSTIILEPTEALQELTALTLPAGSRYRVTITVLSGRVEFAEVTFGEAE